MTDADTTTSIALAKIGRPYGLTGAMHVFPFSADAATLRRAKRIEIRGKAYEVEKLRAHGDAYIMSLPGIDSPEAAAKFTNAEISVARSEFPVLAEGEFYWVDLVGLECVNRTYSEHGARHFGKVIEVFEVGAHPLLRVRAREDQSERDDELIPFVDAIIRSVNLSARVIDVDWQGLHAPEDASAKAPEKRARDA